MSTPIRADDVEIDGKAVVPLGGDYWYVDFPIGQTRTHLVRVCATSQGVLDSDVFTIGLQYLAFLLGGSATKDVALELRVPAKRAGSPGFRALDRPDGDGFVAVRIANPSGSDVLRQYTWDLTGGGHGGGLLNSPAKVRLRNSGRGRRKKRLAADPLLSGYKLNSCSWLQASISETLGPTSKTALVRETTGSTRGVPDVNPMPLRAYPPIAGRGK